MLFLAQAGLHLSPTRAGRMLKEPPHPVAKPQEVSIGRGHREGTQPCMAPRPTSFLYRRRCRDAERSDFKPPIQCVKPKRPHGMLRCRAVHHPESARGSCPYTARDALASGEQQTPWAKNCSQLFSAENGARSRKLLKRLAPQVGLEPTTLRLTAGCSAKLSY